MKRVNAMKVDYVTKSKMWRQYLAILIPLYSAGKENKTHFSLFFVIVGNYLWEKNSHFNFYVKGRFNFTCSYSSYDNYFLRYDVLSFSCSPSAK